VSIDRRTFKVVAEAMREESDGTGPDRDGLYVLGVYRIHPKQVTPHFRMAELAARYQVAHDPTLARPASAERSAVPNTTREIQFGANYYVNRNVRFLANAIVPVDDRESPGTTFIGRMQVIF
jgi:hypothetical protein